MTKLEVLIATYGQAGIDRLADMKLPHVPDVRYLVSCQYAYSQPDIPSSLIREDIRIIFSHTRGLSVNRNNLLQNASAPYCLIADDDLDFIGEGLQKVIEIFDHSPDISVISLQYTDSEGRPEKTYPSDTFPLDSPPKGYYISSIELAFRRTDIIGNNIFFNESFGVGTDRYSCGEEDIWLHDILKAGMKGRYHPVMIALHKGSSSGISRASEPSVLRAQGAVMARLFPATGMPRTVLKAWRVSRITRSPFMRCLIPALEGWTDATFHSKSLFHK